MRLKFKLNFNLLLNPLFYSSTYNFYFFFRNADMNSLIDTPKTSIITSYRLKLNQIQNKDNYNRFNHSRTNSLTNESSFNNNKNNIVVINEPKNRQYSRRYLNQDEKEDDNILNIINNGDDEYGEIDDEVFDDEFNQINNESNKEFNKKLKDQQNNNTSKRERERDKMK